MRGTDTTSNKRSNFMFICVKSWGIKVEAVLKRFQLVKLRPLFQNNYKLITALPQEEIRLLF